MLLRMGQPEDGDDLRTILLATADLDENLELVQGCSVEHYRHVKCLEQRQEKK